LGWGAKSLDSAARHDAVVKEIKKGIAMTEDGGSTSSSSYDSEYPVSSSSSPSFSVIGAKNLSPLLVYAQSIGNVLSSIAERERALRESTNRADFPRHLFNVVGGFCLTPLPSILLDMPLRESFNLRWHTKTNSIKVLRIIREIQEKSKS
jgi:hypothetical protein